MGDTFARDFEATGCLPAAHHPLVRSLDQVVAIDDPEAVQMCASHWHSWFVPLP